MHLFRTRRSYAEKLPESRQSIKMDGYKLTIVGRDYWNGPLPGADPDHEETGEGYWSRGFVLEDHQP